VDGSVVAEFVEEDEDCREAAAVADSRLNEGISDGKDGVSSHVEVAWSTVGQL